ncbi:glycosyltransferase family 2 protein [Pedobacter sp. UYP1]|uniref:glycosyltransferase family 2 protein n=1 Tax=Pedobacter sp. UYP1 TaxID=1756396 RepID=UPI0033952CC1
MDKVSIVIVTYNAVRDLQNCLDSIKKQTYTPLEVIVVDGLSQDGTVDILKKNSDIITKWISEKDNGIYDAMNKALKMVTGDWVYFLGADDLLLTDFSRMLNGLQEKNAIYYGSVLKGKEKYLGYLSPYNQAKIGICHQSMIYPKRVFDKYHFDERYRISADHHLNMKCWADPDFKIQFADFVIADFNETGISSLSKDELFEKEKSGLMLKYFGFSIWSRFLFRELKWWLFNRANRSISS